MISLTFRNGGHSYGYKRIFQGMNISLSSGEIFAITGANGSGKSTVLKILAGVLRPTDGQVELVIEEQAIPAELHPLHVGLVAPYMNPYEDLTLRENLSFIQQARSMNSDSSRVESIVSEVGLGPHLDVPIRTYSTGMQQRARFALALLHQPSILLLDEPTLSLDPKGKEIILKMVGHAQQRGRLVVIASNTEEEISMASRSLCIEEYAVNLG